MILAALASAALVLSATPAQKHSAAAADPAADTSAFRHARHVSLLWPGTSASKVEVARDCRGCHDYSQADPDDNPRPADTCGRCHVLDSMRFEVAEVRVDPADEADRAFRHNQHLRDRDGREFRCSECHSSPAAQAGKRKRLDDPPIIVPDPSFAFCAGCHEKAGNRARFNKGLTQDTRARMEQAGGQREARRFRHEQHLSPAEIASPTPDMCARCHADVPRADARHMAENQVHLERCEECHEGMEFDLATVEKPSLAAATFVHAYHVGTAARGAADMAAPRARLERDGCLACHAWSKEQRTFVVQDFLARPGQGHAGCVTCHASWKVERHGESGSCGHCHAVEEGGLTDLAAQASNRPRVDVLRADPAAFRIEEQAHRFVHTGAAPAGECARCHVASIDRAPSRIGEKPFLHATHLPADFGERAPKDAQNAACTGCHSSVSTSVSTEAIVGTRHGGADSPASFHFDRAACDACHGAPAFAPVVAEPVHARSVLLFDHQRHLNRKHPREPARSITCVDCHRLERGQGDWSIVVDEKIRSCALCHGHDAQRAAITGDLDPDEARACTVCHAPGVPRKGQVVDVGRARVAAVRGAQVHAGDDACSTCHRLPAGSDAGGGRIEIDPAITGVRQAAPNPHAAASRDPKSKPFFQDQVACIDCHWGNMEKPKKNLVDQWRNQGATWASDRAKAALQVDQEVRWREKFGAELEGFPGLTAR